MSRCVRNEHNRDHHHHHHHERRSMRLQNFLTHHHTYTLSEICKHVCEFSQDRDGSKFIQRKLDEAPDHRKIEIFNEILPNLHALMMHRFANFVVQKFFIIGNESQRFELYAHIQMYFVELSLNKYGCRVVQKAIETATTLQLYCLMRQINKNNIMRLVTDANANHVIQNIFRTSLNAPNRHIQDFLFGLIEAKVMELCLDLYGCRVIQCVLQHGSGIHRDQIFDEVWKNPPAVITHRYGNYVVQYLARNCSPPQQSRLIQYVLDNVIAFSMDKYASNVVETCISLATTVQQQHAMQIICAIDPIRLYQFCIGASSNYVVQKLMDSASQEQMDTFYMKIVPFFTQMERYVCGRKIIEKLKTNRNNRIDQNNNLLETALRGLWI